MVKVDWTSLDLMSCPQFQELRRWIATGEVSAVGVLDRDRRQAQGLQRLVFLAECQEHGVQVITAQGVPMLEGPEGQLVELALALGKERSVARAQQGARDGLRHRARRKGLSPNWQSPYGMKWQDQRLVPDDNHPVACDIWRMALEGETLRSIAKKLTQQGVPTAKGGRVRSATTIGSILANRSYAGVVEEMGKLERQARQEREAEAQAFRLASRYHLSEDVFRQKLDVIRNRRQGIEQRRRRVLAQLEMLDQGFPTAQAMEARQQRLGPVLSSQAPGPERHS